MALCCFIFKTGADLLDAVLLCIMCLSLPTSISLTRSGIGIPRIIAPFHRKLIRRWADVVVKIYPFGNLLWPSL